MELPKQEMELFLLFSQLWLKNFFYKMFLNFANEFKTGFENRKWNYPNKKMELFLLLPDLQSKNFFNKKFLPFKKESKTGFENRK